jgi:hypothetical protein
MSNIKPGCVAVLIRPWQRDEDIGRPVTVVRRAINGETRLMRNGVQASATGPGSTTAFLIDASGGEFPCFAASYCLRRIDDPGKEVCNETVEQHPTQTKEIA